MDLTREPDVQRLLEEGKLYLDHRGRVWKAHRRTVPRTGPAVRGGNEFRRAFSGIMPRREAAVLNATLAAPERAKPAQGGLRERLRRGR